MENGAQGVPELSSAPDTAQKPALTGAGLTGKEALRKAPGAVLEGGWGTESLDGSCPALPRGTEVTPVIFCYNSVTL